MIDLKESQRIKNLLEQSPEDYERIIEETPLAICVTDSNGNYSAVNENYLRLYGYSKDEMVGSSFLMVVPVDDQDRLQELHDIFMKLKDEIMRNWEVKHKDGRLFTISADAGFSPDLLGKPHKVTFIWPDAEKDQIRMHERD